jgi:hypothetical protein
MTIIGGIFYTIFFLVLVWIIIIFIEKRKTKRLKKNYKEDKNESRKGEFNRKFGKRESSIERSPFLTERVSLQATNADSIESNKSGVEHPNKINQLFRSWGKGK